MENIETQDDQQSAVTTVYGDVSNLVWADEAHTMINMDVFFLVLNEAITFTASPNDPEPHGRELYARAVAGDFGPVSPYID